MPKSKYRTWFDSSSDEEFFLRINSDGSMVQISIFEDIHDKRILIVKTKPLNMLNTEVFIKHKEVCKKSDFDKARKEALELLNS